MSNADSYMESLAAQAPCNCSDEGQAWAF